MSDLVFYTNPQSRGQTVRWMLEEVGAPYETEILDYASGMKSEPYLSINPMGKVPAIRHRGKVVTEVAAICCYLAVTFLKPKLGYDDALDTFGIHGIGGIVGALGTGVVYSASLGGPSPDGWSMSAQLVTQFLTVGGTIAWAAIGTTVAIYVAKALTGLRVSPDVEREGLDLGEHGERAYNH